MLPTRFPSRKINVPVVNEESIRRWRLLKCFKEIGDSDLILVSAPAGYGKTTLLANWAGECNQPTAWLSIDRGDNDEFLFWRLIIEAFRIAVYDHETEKGKINFGESTLELIEKGRGTDRNYYGIERIVSNLIHEIEQLEIESLWLIVDDYHQVQNNLIHHGVSYLLKYQPAFLHLAIGTRADPPLNLDKMRSCNQVTEVRLDSLRFTEEEAGYYLNDYSSLGLSKDEISRLVNRTQGWISALQLAAGALGSRSNRTEFIASLSGKFETIAGFLAAEILHKQEKEFQTFLLQTSILDQLSGPICNILTGRTDSHRILQGMRWTDIPLEPLDNTLTLFQYQILFSDMLRQRLRNEYPEKFTELHTIASRWFIEEAKRMGEQELLAMGIEHAIASQDFQRATNLLDEHALHLIEVGFESTVMAWIDKLPIEFTLSSPILSAFSLYGLLASGNIQRAEKHLVDATKYFDPVEKNSPKQRDGQIQDDSVFKQGMLFALRSHVAAHGDDLDWAIELADAALSTLPENYPFWSAISLLAKAGAYMMKGDMITAQKNYEQALLFSQEQDSAYLVRVTDIKNLACLYYRGEMTRIETIYKNSKTLGIPIRLSDRLFGGNLDSHYSWVLCEANRLEEALTHAMIGIEKSEQTENYYVLPISWLAMIQIQNAIGDQEGIDESIINLERISRKVTLQTWTDKRLRAWKLQSLISKNNLSKARTLVEQWGVAIEPKPRFLDEELNLAYVRLLIAEGQYTEAIRFLKILLADAEKGGRTRKVIEVLNLLASIHVKQGDLLAALSYLGEALQIAEPFDYLRIFLDEGEPLINLLRKGIDAGIHPEYIKIILHSHNESSENKPGGEDVLINPLSQREWDVLELLEQRMTNDDIATNLVVSTSTVRTHLRSIFRKLGVHRRWDAVEKARELKLL